MASYLDGGWFDPAKALRIFVDPDFIDLSQRIDAAIIKHFAGNEDVIAWQVDNEVGGQNDCFCEICKAAFHCYLEDKYGTPAALNEAWGKNFWSFGFNDFAEVPIPGTQPQLILEYRRFMSHLNVEFTRWRSELIHKVDPGKQVTTNFQSVPAVHTDYHQLSSVIDVNGMNHYPSRSPELALDYYRGSRGAIWALEQHTRLQPVDTPIGWMRLWAWMAVAHGANAIVFFRWRQCRWGQEQYADGLLPHSGNTNRLYEDLKKMGAEIKQIGEFIDQTSPLSQVALVFNYESRWAISAGRFTKAFDPIEDAIAYHRTLARYISAIDGMDPSEDLSQYKLVIAPRLWIIDEMVAHNLEKYVEAGGTLVLTPGCGVADVYGKSFLEPRPGPVRKLTGITVSDLAFQTGMRLPLQSDIIPELQGTAGHSAADEIHPGSASVVATYAGGWRQDEPAITLNQMGSGRVIYIGTLLEKDALHAVVRWLIAVAGIDTLSGVPEGVSVYERQSAACRLMFIINWGQMDQVMTPSEGWRDAFTNELTSTVTIPTGDIRILCTSPGTQKENA